jgi:hypothetical protein
LTGRTLDRDELEVCEKAAGSGFLAAVRGLLAHHQFTGNTRAAQYFADLCEMVLGLRCADVLADYYQDRSKLIVRTVLINEACAMQRVDLATGAVAANPQCPWRKPIAIPAEFLTTAR